MVFKNLDVFEAHVSFKVCDPFSVHVEEEEKFLFAKAGHRFCVGPVFYDDLMGADIFHLIVDALGPLVFVNLYDEYWVCCGETADKPVILGVLVFPDRMGRQIFIARAKRADARAA